MSEPLDSREVAFPSDLQPMDLAPDDQVSSGALPVIDADESTLLPFPIVAFGGSAGGVEAYIEIFKHVPADTGMAFIVVSHLAPSHKSHLVEILAKQTALPVCVIEDGMRPESNHIYVLPPNVVLSMKNGLLQLQPRPEQRPFIIDDFFRSLAADQKNNAIGVVLSGMDADGAQGLKAIKGEGGIAIVQSPESARYPSMPRNSIQADHVDLVVTPADIGFELGRLASQLSRPEMRSLESGIAPERESGDFTQILNLLTNVSQVDFRGYKAATLHRRMGRRMVLKRIQNLGEYRRYLQVHHEELLDLQEDVLIGVTRFFRDAEIFHVLKSDVLPRIIENRATERRIRIWVAGCSTGEEAYSIAISLLEVLAGETEEPLIQIFGTDASERSIQRARHGVYPDSLVADVSQERLRRFFTKVDNGYQVTKRVRDLCVFARQNLCIDPPFGNLDMVTCRNVLIYFGQELQKRVLPTFHYALRPNGFLLLGNTETIHGYEGLFAPLDRKNRFYTKIGGPSPLELAARRAVTIPGLEGDRAPLPVDLQAPWKEIDLQRAADRIVIARHGPSGVIINERQEIVQSRGHTSSFLEMAQGTSSLTLVRMLRESIAPQVQDAVRRAIEQDVAVLVPELTVRDEENLRQVALEVLPIPTHTNQLKHYLVLFPRVRELGERLAPVAPIAIPPGTRDQLTDQLRSDLEATKLYLQSLIEERDAKHQELISANEEIQSSNEELQSANEELETTKEELQSSNEELQTVNEELQVRNISLSQTSNDLTNLLNSVNLPLLMLNNLLEIRQFTPPTERLMNLRASDIGRPINEIRLNLSVEDLEPILHEVLENLNTRELEVQDRDGRWRLLRVRPYRTTDNKIEGVVLLLVDVDELRRSRQELQEARDYARAVVQCMPTPVAVLNMDLSIRTINESFRSLANLRSRDLGQITLPELTSELWNMEESRPRLLKLAASADLNATTDFEHSFEEGQEKRTLKVWARTLLADGERVILVTFEDISAQRRADLLEQQVRQDLRGQIQSTEETLGRTQSELRALAGRLFTSQEEERRRVARELHDDITQKLAHLQIQLEQMQHAPPTDAAEVANRTKLLAERTAALSTSVRDISHRLHPSILDDLGIVEALRSLVEDFRQREGMETTFRYTNVPESTPLEVAGVLYRITQEALRNVAKHAGKTHVKILLEGSPSRLQLEVRDSGEGFNVEEKGAGLGFVSMAERARLVQGSLTIESAAGIGTIVRVQVPMTTLEAMNGEESPSN